MAKDAAKAQGNFRDIMDRSKFLSVVQSLDTVAHEAIKHWEGRSDCAPEMVSLA
jgi:hypothetical protein